MCTVTYLPVNNGYFLTSNRDEKTARPTLKPELYCTKNGKWIYPKDMIAGGSWIAVGEQKARCLLNGAMENHLPNTKQYKRSRGQVLLESLEFKDDRNFIEHVDLSETEPFTLILIDNTNKKFYLELKWDGKRKLVHELPINVPRIWSSVTLYSESIIEGRRAWYAKWLSSEVIQAEKMLEFHLFKHTDNSFENVLMERNNGDLKTVSVSQIVRYKDHSYFKYLDLLDNSQINHQLNPTELCIQDGQ
ncbi:NRDE family protein [Arcticibacterium luteifluviistationis]|uniref:NRDE family protein n=1 Tax=Arcticibacterium luteifluviistationis TaxID=1784714 RepID=A0A2Z4GC05_9BACT|nr:NRDE family protein [Arcticibacterium luteifluviistationis]AWV98463.1 hypothetical protein DJ013_09880 [Arcticibacterium luteifluviistationis]